MSETNIESYYAVQCCPNRLTDPQSNYFLYLIKYLPKMFFVLKRELRLLALFLSLERTFIR